MANHVKNIGTSLKGILYWKVSSIRHFDSHYKIMVIEHKRSKKQMRNSNKMVYPEANIWRWTQQKQEFAQFCVNIVLCIDTKTE
jgi:hypothetical protein